MKLALGTRKRTQKEKYKAVAGSNRSPSYRSILRSALSIRFGSRLYVSCCVAVLLTLAELLFLVRCREARAS